MTKSENVSSRIIEGTNRQRKFLVKQVLMSQQEEIKADIIHKTSRKQEVS